MEKLKESQGGVLGCRQCYFLIQVIIIQMSSLLSFIELYFYDLCPYLSLLYFSLKQLRQSKYYQSGVQKKSVSTLIPPSPTSSPQGITLLRKGSWWSCSAVLHLLLQGTWARCLLAFPGLPVVGQNCVTSSGQWVVSRSDVCRPDQGIQSPVKVLDISFPPTPGTCCFLVSVLPSALFSGMDYDKSQFTMDTGKRHEQGMCVMLKPLEMGG